MAPDPSPFAAAPRAPATPPARARAPEDQEDPAAERRLGDEILVLGALQGDRLAFEELASGWQERMWRHAYRLLGDAEAARDVVQESWLAIAGGIGRLRDPASFPAWALRIVTRRARDVARRRGRRAPPARLAEEGLADPGAADPAGAEPEGAVELLRRALRRLPPEPRALLGLHYVEGLALREIAGVLGIPEGTVKSRLHQARAELRATVERMHP